MTAVLSLFRGLIEPPEHTKTMAALLRETATDWSLEPGTLLSPCRKQAVVFPRQDFMWRARHVYGEDGKPKFSLPRIARFLGLKDHTTVLHGVRAHEHRADEQKARAA